MNGLIGFLINDFFFVEFYVVIVYVEGVELVFFVWFFDKDSYEGCFLVVGNGGYVGIIDWVNMLC